MTARRAARDHLALALDVDDLVAALRIARPLLDYFSVAKVGLELFSASGPEASCALSTAGFDVFVDLKLHDIPTTVGRAARVLGALGVSLRNGAHIGRPRDGRGGNSGNGRGRDVCGTRASLRPRCHGPHERHRSAAPTSSPAERRSLRTADAEESSARRRTCRSLPRRHRACARWCPGSAPLRCGHDDQARVATPSAAIRSRGGPARDRQGRDCCRRPARPRRPGSTTRSAARARSRMAPV